MLFFVRMFEGCKHIRLSTHVQILSLETLLEVLRSLKDALVAFRDQFGTQMPGLTLNLQLECTYIGIDTILEHMQVLVPTLLEVYELQHELRRGEILSCNGLIAQFQEMSRSGPYSTWIRHPNRLRWQEHMLQQQVEALGLESSDLQSQWYDWQERLLFLAQQMCPGFTQEFSASGNVEDDILALLAVVMKGRHILFR